MKKRSLFDDQKKITVSIVTYNNSDEIDALMQSLNTSTSFGDLAVYVIDNASKDNTVKRIRKNYPWAKVIANTENLGFGKAHNLVINKVTSKYHIIINPDITIQKGTIAKAISYLSKNPDVALASPFVMNQDGSQQFLPKRNPSLKYMVGGLFENKSKLCKKWRDEYTLKGKVISSPIDVDFCTGAFMVTRTAALQKVGGFDERYFLHFEDADLTRKIKKIGRTVYNPEIKVTHKWHRDNKKLNKSFWIALKSMLVYMHKWNKANA